MQILKKIFNKIKCLFIKPKSCFKPTEIVFRRKIINYHQVWDMGGKAFQECDLTFNNIKNCGGLYCCRINHGADFNLFDINSYTAGDGIFVIGNFAIPRSKKCRY